MATKQRGVTAAKWGQLRRYVSTEHQAFLRLANDPRIDNEQRQQRIMVGRAYEIMGSRMDQLRQAVK